jgi:hypothetical protein
MPWRQQQDRRDQRSHQADHEQRVGSSAAAAMHLPPPGSDPGFGLRFGRTGRASTPLLGADLRLSGDGGFSGFSSPAKGRQGSLPCDQHTDGMLQEDVLRMLTFGRLSPLPTGVPGADPRQAMASGLLSPLWTSNSQTAPTYGGGRRSPARCACKSHSTIGTCVGSWAIMQAWHQRV